MRVPALWHSSRLFTQNSGTVNPVFCNSRCISSAQSSINLIQISLPILEIAFDLRSNHRRIWGLVFMSHCNMFQI